MSQAGQFLQYAEERDPPRRRVSSSVWKYSPPARASEYHPSICLAAFPTADLKR